MLEVFRHLDGNRSALPNDRIGAGREFVYHHSHLEVIEDLRNFQPGV